MAKVTLVIALDGSAAAGGLLASAFLDDARNLDETGQTRTQFSPGDAPYFLVHLDPALTIRAVECSSGGARYLGMVTREATVDQLDVDADGDTAELEYIPSAEPEFWWYGNTPAVARDGRTLAFTGALPAAGGATYTYRAHSYQYLPPSLEPTREWRTRIVIHVMEAS